MSEDLTQKLPPQSFEERVLAEFAAIRQELAQVKTRLGGVDRRLDALDTHLTSLEEKVDERLRETRPIWEGVLQRSRQIETTLSDLTGRSDR